MYYAGDFEIYKYIGEESFVAIVIGLSARGMCTKRGVNGKCS